jgi:hypothetical protein
VIEVTEVTEVLVASSLQAALVVKPSAAMMVRTRSCIARS